ncbi:hypothetical protein Barb6_02516 [Bacteroidales bacterium Barb6]|nr:hypothetical protein Barb6_02516 [Bacteroidales bacterium Barb6]
MKLLEKMERVCRIHKLLKLEATGTSDEFAERLNLKRRQVYNILEELREIGADIQYDTVRRTYYYGNDFDIEVRIGKGRL